MTLSDELWRLVKAGRFQDAITAGEKALAEPGGAPVILGNLTLAYMATGDFNSAYRCAAARDAAESTSRRLGLRFLNDMASAAWLAGDKMLSLEHAKRDVELLSNGESNYADASGGTSNALFLRYCSLMLRDEHGQALALRYLKSISKRRSFSNWPGPLGSHFLGTASFEDVLLSASGESAVPTALLAAKTDTLKRRQLIEALFYLGVKKREAGDQAGCLALMEHCCSFENPYNETEWYLAQQEVREPDS
ncbi:MAG: hypothetical protein ABL996_15160 [Micropepsaceae bacterium]